MAQRPRQPFECAVCRQPVEQRGGGAPTWRLYLGPGDKLAELWLPALRPTHAERFP